MIRALTLIGVLLCFSREALCSLESPNMSWIEEEPCDRGLSRQVREFVQKSVYPHLGASPQRLPRSCQLHPDQDMYADHEKHKEEDSRMDYRCTYCGKHFKTEFYLDKHMHNMHADKLVEGSGNMCLASLCPIFGCRDTMGHNGAYKSTPNVQKRTTSSGKVNMGKLHEQKNFDLGSMCTSAEVEKSKYQCEVLVRRCFGGLDGDLDEYFEEQICNKLHCDEGVLRGSIIETGMRKGSSQGGYGGGSGSSDPHSAYHKDGEGEGVSFLRKLFLFLFLLAVGGYLAIFIFCGSSVKTLWGGDKKLTAAAVGNKGKYRVSQEQSASIGALASNAAKLLGGRKRHDS